MNIAPKPPLARQGQQLATHGRYGDSELVHMNPYEVQGLAAMSPTGQLTKNPVTGQPEAFLPFLAPIIGSALGKAAIGKAIGSGLAGAVGSGLATWAQTGDFEKGLIGGITGFGLGKVMGAAQTAGEATQAANQLGDIASSAGLDNAQTAALQAAQSGAKEFGANVLTDQSGAFTAGMPEIVSANTPSTFGQNLANIGRGFTTPEGLTSVANTAMSPGVLLPAAVGQGTMAQVEAQEGMDKLRKEATARDNRYAQSFQDVLTDSLGMARGTNPNPYMGKYAKGGIVGMRNGGDLDRTEGMTDEEYRDYMVGAQAEDSIAGYGLDADNRYFIRPKKGTGAERQSFLRGNFKQDAPTDYRHGFEKEFQFFDFVEDRPVERYADLFGAGASDYLAGLLAGNTGNAPTTPTYNLRDVDQATLKGTQFSGAGPGAGQGGDEAMAPLPAAPVGGTVTNLPPSGGVAGGTDGGIITTQSPGGGTVVPPSGGTPVSAGMKAIQALGYDRDQDYNREEGEAVYDIMQEYGVGDDEVAEYFFDQAYLDDPTQSTANVAEAAAAIGDRYQTGVDLGLGQKFGGDGSFDDTDVARVYENLTSDDGVGLAQAADYFNLTGEELQANIDAITARDAAEASKAQAAAVLDGVPVEQVYDLIESGDVSVSQVADYFDYDYEEVRAAQDAIAAQRAATGYVPPAPVIPTAGTIDLQDLQDADDAIFAGMSPNELRQAGISVGASGGRIGKKRFNTPLGMVEMANGGIAELPANLPMTAEVPEETVMMESETVIEEPMPDRDFPELVEMTVEAIKGNIENSDEVINQFIEEYGVEEFRNLREIVLQGIVPEAQTEGMIDGESGGMDDEVMGMIGEDQQVAVSPGEYIVAADVVSGLGDGNSDAGAVVLDEMMQGVRNARSGGQQPKPLNKAAVMPS